MRHSDRILADIQRHRQPPYSVYSGGQRRSYSAGVQNSSSYIRAVIHTGQDQVRCRIQPAADRREHDVTGLCVDCIRLHIGEISQRTSLDRSGRLARSR